ncbi:MAG: DNA alkylation repair protein [Alistipes sp.]|nr:DNA alkylation repair protein [Alistipes sp.]
MSQTERMITLLGSLRREMNGAVADSMYYSGKRYGLNYGVSIPTIRTIARQEPKDMALAKYLIEQQVRELQLAALHITPAEELTAEDAIEFEKHITNSEIAEEASFSVFGKCSCINELCERWIDSGDEQLIYCALLSAARNPLAAKPIIAAKLRQIISDGTSNIVVQGAIVLLTAIANSPDKEIVSDLLKTLPDTAASDKIREEVVWMLEY